LENLIAPDSVPRLLSRGDDNRSSRASSGGFNSRRGNDGCFQEIARLGLLSQQRFDAVTQLAISSARRIQESRARSRSRFLQRASDQRYECGIAISDTGKLAWPWRQQDEPIFNENGGHGLIFNSFTGKLMLVLHAPDGRGPRPHIFAIEDTRETLRIVKELASTE
jgi:hypothetical protein